MKLEDCNDNCCAARVASPHFFPRVKVADDGHSVEILSESELSDDDIQEDTRDTIPAPPPYPHNLFPQEERRYSKVSLALSFSLGLFFWGVLGYLVTR